jgi:hypothetical protein
MDNPVSTFWQAADVGEDAGTVKVEEEVAQLLLRQRDAVPA